MFGRAMSRSAAAAVAAGAVVLAVGVPAPASFAQNAAPDTAQVTVTPVGNTGISVAAAELAAAMTVPELAATVVMGHIPTANPDVLRAYMDDTGVGGFILMGSNVGADENAVRAVTAALTLDPALPPLIAIDEEGGDVARLPWDDLPGAFRLKNDPVVATTAAFAARSALLARAGVTVNFGIVADVTSDPGMFIYGRALGTSPGRSSDRVVAAVTGEQGSVMSTLKHFPGHGAAPGDSHQRIPTTAMSLEEWSNTDAKPFEAGADAGAELLMFGHLRYTAVDDAPASLSAEWHAIARDKLGFRGVIITDDLGMLEASGEPAYQDPVSNAVQALIAGNDMVLAVVGTSPDSASRIVSGIETAVADGTLSTERLVEAATRVLTLRLDAAARGAALLPCTDCTPAS